MDKTIFDTYETALNKAKNELSVAIHLEECGNNAGIRRMNANKAEWLKWVVYLAELGLEAEKLLAEQDKKPDGVICEHESETQLVSDFQNVLALFKAISSIKL
jgi:hypothetical protein